MEILLGVASLLTASGTALGGVVVVTQLTAPARLRAQLTKELEIHDKLTDGPARQLLAKAIHHKAARLAGYELVRFPPHVYMLGVLLVVVVLLYAEYVVGVRTQGWPAWVTWVLVGLVVTGYCFLQFTWFSAYRRIRQQRGDAARDTIEDEPGASA